MLIVPSYLLALFRTEHNFIAVVTRDTIRQRFVALLKFLVPTFLRTNNRVRSVIQKKLARSDIFFCDLMSTLRFSVFKTQSIRKSWNSLVVRFDRKSASGFINFFVGVRYFFLLACESILYILNLDSF